jgi:rhodanese-related sulfurtransferase
VTLVCLTDRRSSRAAAILLGAGHQRLTVLRGGMKGWNAAGLPVGGTTVQVEATPREKRA